MTKSKKRQIVPEPQAGAFLGMAHQYHQAATKLASLGSDADSPLYFLYTHAIELALKAYLRSQGPPAPRTHSLTLLLQKSRQLGLRASLDLRNVVELLESENSVHGFRYFSEISTWIPDLAFLREVVDTLMPTVDEVVRKIPDSDNEGGVVGKATFVVGKPTRK